MNRSARLAFLSAASLLTSGVLLAESAPIPFAEATFTEIVNDVQIVSGADAQGRKAAKSDKFLAPDLVKTGRKSRAELKAVDGTVARVGSNAVFSFDKSSRSMNLQSGSVLFHSPTGKGGGTVVTNSATASVIGTTIMVIATSDGGFKLLVLEGVAKVTLGGVVTQIMPGQMTFILPTKAGETAQLGPVLNFDLDALVKDSNLVAGFDDSLASLEKIKDAIAEQELKIQDGDLRKTGLFIIGANDANGFNVADAATIRQTVIQQQQGDQARLAESLRASFIFNGEGPIPEAYIFRTPVFIDPALLGLNIPAGDVNGGFVGVLVGHLELNTSVFNLGFIDGAADTITLGGLSSSSLVIPGNITFNGLAKSHNLRIVGGRLVIAPGAQIDVVFDNATLARPVSAEFISLTGVTITGAGFTNSTGNLEISAITGDLTLDSVTATAGTNTTALAPPLTDGPLEVPTGLLAPATLELRAPLGILTLINGVYQASGDIRAEGARGVSATGTSFSAGIVNIDGADITLDGGSVTASKIYIERSPGVLASTLTVKNGASLNAFGGTFTEAGVNLRAATIVLDGATFTGGTTATLRVTTGNLTSGFDGTNPVTGNANIYNSTYAGEDIVTDNKVWVPTMNIGDVSAPIHVLDATTADYRGTKKAYAMSKPLAMGIGSFLPHSYEFDLNDATEANPNAQQSQSPSLVLLKSADLGLPDDTVLPEISMFTGERSHSAYEVNGVFAADLRLNNATLDLSRFDSATQYARADIVAGTMHLSGTVTVTGLTQTRSLELRALNFDIASGTTLVAGLAPDQQLSNGIVVIASANNLNLDNFTLNNAAGGVHLVSFSGLTMNGGLLASGSVPDAIAADISLESESSVSVTGGAQIYSTSNATLQSNGFVTVSGVGTVVSGVYVNLSSGAGDVTIGTGVEVRAASGMNLSSAAAISITGAVLDADSFSTSTGYIYAAATTRIDVSGSSLLVKDDSTLSSGGTIQLSASEVHLTNSELRTLDSNTDTYGRYIEINGSVAVTITGGFLKADDIIVRGRSVYDQQAGVYVYRPLESLDVNGVGFALNGGSSSGSNNGVFLEARTVNISNVTFPEFTEIRLQSENGTLNLGNTTMFGAVNFRSNVAITYGGSAQTLVDGAGAANVANLNNLVWVENSSAGSKIFVNNGGAQTAITGNSSSTSAPIHIQALGTPSSVPVLPGSHPTNFVPGINNNN